MTVVLSPSSGYIGIGGGNDGGGGEIVRNAKKRIKIPICS